MTPYTRKPRPLSPAQRLALAVLRGEASYPTPQIVKGSRSAFAPTIKRMPIAERRVALRAKDGGKA